MCETPKETEEKEPEVSGSKDQGCWEEDQKKLDYYYDDSHGYETYDPDQAEEDSEQCQVIRRKG